MEMLQYPFMQKALLVGLLVGSLCPTIGLFLVMRRLSMVGDTLAHVSLTGVLLGVLWKLNPLPVALGLLCSSFPSLGKTAQGIQIFRRNLSGDYYGRRAGNFRYSYGNY